MVYLLMMFVLMLNFLINYVTLMYKECNKVAHSLARYALGILDFVV